MMKNKYSVIIMMIALFGGQTALAQEKIVPETRSILLILRRSRSSAPTI